MVTIFDCISSTSSSERLRLPNIKLAAVVVVVVGNNMTLCVDFKVNNNCYKQK